MRIYSIKSQAISPLNKSGKAIYTKQTPLPCQKQSSEAIMSFRMQNRREERAAALPRHSGGATFTFKCKLTHTHTKTRKRERERDEKRGSCEESVASLDLIFYTSNGWALPRATCKVVVAHTHTDEQSREQFIFFPLLMLMLLWHRREGKILLFLLFYI